MKLFESILNNLLNESISEGAIVNPNDTSKDVFDIEPITIKGMTKVKIKVNLDGEDIKKIEPLAKSGQIDPKLFRCNSLIATVDPDGLNDPNSDGYKKIVQLCQIVSQLGKYGQIDPSEIFSDAKFNGEQAYTAQKGAEIDKNEDELWDEFVKNFDNPRIQALLQSFHAYLPLHALDDRRSDRNIASILSQDAKRIAAGKEPATFVAKPQDWRAMNRRIKKDAIPFYLWYRRDGNEPSNDAYERHLDNSLGLDKRNVIGDKTAKDWATELKQAGGMKLGPYRNVHYGARRVAGNGNGYGRDAYYDVADTEPISGLTDIWNDENREGLVDNIKWIPTEASKNKFANDNNMSKEELESEMGGLDTKYTIAAYNALKVLCWDISESDDLGNEISAIRKSTPQNADGTLDLEKIKSQVFDMATAYVAKKSKEFAKPETRIAKSKMVACMFVGAHRIAPNKAIEIFRGLDKSELNSEGINNQADKIQFAYKTKYNVLASAVKAAIDREFNKQKQQNKKAMEESINYGHNPMDKFYGAIDNIMNELGINKDGEELSQEDISLNEAKFYHLFNKINQKRF